MSKEIRLPRTLILCQVDNRYAGCRRTVNHLYWLSWEKLRAFSSSLSPTAFIIYQATVASLVWNVYLNPDFVIRTVKQLRYFFFVFIVTRNCWGS